LGLEGIIEGMITSGAVKETVSIYIIVYSYKQKSPAEEAFRLGMQIFFIPTTDDLYNVAKPSAFGSWEVWFAFSVCYFVTERAEQWVKTSQGRHGLYQMHREIRV
jgi:hypothetical protein